MTDSEAAPEPGNANAEITLGLLNAVEENEELTQRSIALELGVALGLVNAYLKRCVKKGFIKVRQIPKNRYAYYLTPQGFSEKSRLTAEYLSQSFNFFRAARSQCATIFERCEANGWRKIVLVGVSDLGEIATFCAREYEVELIGFADQTYGGERFADLPVWRDGSLLGQADAAIITHLSAPQDAFFQACAVLGPERVMAPALLRVSPNAPKPDLDREPGR